VELALLPDAKVAAGLDGWLVFPSGVGNYVEQLERVLPLRGGDEVRTALDIGCGVGDCTNHEVVSICNRDVAFFEDDLLMHL
jgi:hypothetical protein